MMEKGSGPPVAASMDEYDGVHPMVYVYGILSWALITAPLIIYLIQDNTNTYKPFHNSYITKLAASYTPLALIAPFAIFMDSAKHREVLRWSLMFTGMGPFALLWVGYYDFLM